MSRRVLFGVVVLTVLLLLGWIMGSSEVAAGDAPAGEDPAQQREPDEPVQTRVPRPGERTVTEPRKTRTSAEPLEVAAMEDVPEPEATLEDTAVEPLRRFLPPVTAEQTPAAIREVVDEMIPEVKDCVEAWAMEYPELSGHVDMRFDIGPAGLGEVWVQDHSDVPMGVQSCFGSAIYGADWPRFEDEAEVVHPFLFDLEPVTP